MKNSGIPLSSLNRKMQNQVAAQINSGQLKPSKWADLLEPARPSFSHVAATAPVHMALTQEQMGNTCKGVTYALSPPIFRYNAYPAFTLPYPPSTNSMYATFNNRRILSKAGREYKKAVASLALTLGIKVLTGPVILTVEVYRPIKSGDLSNRLKILEDALKGIAWEDDKQVVSIVARRFDDKENPRVRVRVEPAASLDPQLG